MTQRKANLTTTTHWLRNRLCTQSSSLRTTYTRSLREPQQVMLCQSAADLSSINGACHPPAVALNCGDVHVWSGSIGGTVIQCTVGFMILCSDPVTTHHSQFVSKKHGPSNALWNLIESVTVAEPVICT